MGSTFLFLCRLAWAARYRIPLIISVVFLVVDFHVHLEINMDVREHRRDRLDYIPMREDDNNSEGSWITIEEGELIRVTDEDEFETGVILTEA